MRKTNIARNQALFSELFPERSQSLNVRVLSVYVSLMRIHK